MDLSSRVAIVVFILVPQSKLLRKSLMDHLIGHLLTHTLEDIYTTFTYRSSKKKEGGGCFNT